MLQAYTLSSTFVYVKMQWSEKEEDGRQNSDNVKYELKSYYKKYYKKGIESMRYEYNSFLMIDTNVSKL